MSELWLTLGAGRGESEGVVTTEEIDEMILRAETNPHANI
ncbi:MAG: hypothetical protein JWP63_6349, partial [Candidatus Solibacter sp.]|nr:hypothetical protein [Candidatus Solibacter sp.]